MAASIDFAKLRDHTLRSSQEEEAVTVNTRALIDKVLARYSGEWTTLRELIQNAADASASTVKIRFETIPSPITPLPQSTDPSAFLKHTVLHHTLRRLLVSNDGQSFGPKDWARLRRIAEGNPDENKIGAFGVGFYSVFSECENPFVSSGKETMAFYWKANSLYTRKGLLPAETPSTDTCFVLDYRSTTSKVPDLLSICQFLSSSLTFVGLDRIELWLDNWNLITLVKKSNPSFQMTIPKDIDTDAKEGLMRITSAEAQKVQIDAKWMNVIGWMPSIFENGRKTIQDADGSTPTPSLRTFFSRLTGLSQGNAVAKKAARADEDAQRAIAQDITGTSQVSIFFSATSVSVKSQLSNSFAAELERATKKPPPKQTRISILTSCYDENVASKSTVAGIASSKADDLLSSILPIKNGRIFIGFPTVQTTGLLAHISAPSLIPTVERESIDFNARYVRSWNMALLSLAGIACRITYSNEIASLNENLKSLKKHVVGTRSDDFEISKVLPSATHTLKQFTFRESTPLSRAGQLVEGSFWTCHKKETIEILSSKGVLPSAEVRIASDDLNFLSGIPVVPTKLQEEAHDFVCKLRDFGFISEITIDDTKAELKRTPLNEPQLEEFLRWGVRKIKSGAVNTEVISSLFKETIVSIPQDGTKDSIGKLVMLWKIDTFINSSIIPPELPVPPETIPFKYVRGMLPVELCMLGWKELHIVTWLRWLVDAADRRTLPPNQSMISSSAFAGSVLPVVSRAWESLTPASKTLVTDLLSTRTVIPTKLGMRKPMDAYFASVKLFDDLPTVSNLTGVKEKFLKALGVRKTIDLAVIFERLMATSDNPNNLKKPPEWSHVDLIRYLVSVRSDIPEQDIALLRRTPLCPAEDEDDRRKPSGHLFIVAKLYEPKDSIRLLGLPVMQWPTKLDPDSVEGKFLRSLGLRPYPSIPELIEILIDTHGNANILRYEQALKYIVDNHLQNNYSSFNLSQSTKAFLPLQYEPQRLAKPSACYTNPGVRFFKYSILRDDLQSHASKFGVSANPSISDCVLRLIQNPPEDDSEAKNMYNYFAGRLNEISVQIKERLKHALVVPVIVQDGGSKVRHVSPASCFIGRSDEYGQILNFVDFGNSANSFLLAVGSKFEPSIFELTQLLVREPTRFLQTLNSHEKYLALLRRVHLRVHDLQKDTILWKDMRQASFLLASRDVRGSSDRVGKNANIDDKDTATWDDEVENTYKEWSLAPPKDIVVIDDVISYTLFRDHLRAAPQEDGLEELYRMLGVLPVSNLIEDEYRLGAKRSNQARAISLQKLILERSRLFLHDQPSGSVRKDAKWLETNLEVQLVQSVSLRRSLKSYGVSHADERTAALTTSSKSKCMLSITSDYDLWQVSNLIIFFLLERPKTQHALLLETLLATPLEKLRLRGYNVSRILQRKAEEARIAQIVKERTNDEERRREDGKTRNNGPGLPSLSVPDIRAEKCADNNLQEGESSSIQNPIPGAFIDFSETPQQTAKKSSILSQLSKHLGYGYAGLSSSVAQNHNKGNSDSPDKASVERLPPPYSAIGTHNIRDSCAGEPVTDPHKVQGILISAIKASRSHNSNEIFAPPHMSDVKETTSYCDEKPGQNINYCATSKGGLKIFISNTIAEKSAFYMSNHAGLEAFSSLSLTCAKVFDLAPTCLHIFYDEAGTTIAFNREGSVFLNYRFFVQLHLAGIHRSDGKNQAFVYWWVTLCHELAHNLVADHSAGHSYYTEQFVAAYIPKVIQTLAFLQAGSNEKDS